MADGNLTVTIFFITVIEFFKNCRRKFKLTWTACYSSKEAESRKVVYYSTTLQLNLRVFLLFNRFWVGAARLSCIKTLLTGISFFEGELLAGGNSKYVKA